MGTTPSFSVIFTKGNNFCFPLFASLSEFFQNGSTCEGKNYRSKFFSKTLLHSKRPKTVYNTGISECNRVKGGTPTEKGDKN